jgi:hypothetical protein
VTGLVWLVMAHRHLKPCSDYECRSGCFLCIEETLVKWSWRIHRP